VNIVGCRGSALAGGLPTNVRRIGAGVTGRGGAGVQRWPSCSPITISTCSASVSAHAIAHVRGFVSLRKVAVLTTAGYPEPLGIRTPRGHRGAVARHGRGFGDPREARRAAWPVHEGDPSTACAGRRSSTWCGGCDGQERGRRPGPRLHAGVPHWAPAAPAVPASAARQQRPDRLLYRRRGMHPR